MEENRKISHALPERIPSYITEYYPLFVIFMTKYFEYLDNSSTGVHHTIQNIQLNRDIDTTATDLAVQFLNTYVPNLPNDSAADQTILVKYFKECFKNKGNEKSFKFFFKAFFNDDIQVTNPRDSMFKTSDGDWYIEKGIRVNAVTGVPDNLKHTWVTGLTSTASAIINDVIQVIGQNGANVYDLIFETNSNRGTFTSGETIRGIYYNFDADTTSYVTVASMSAAETKPGVYKNSNSHLSYNQVLQDSVYYQQFSYVLKSSYDREAWADHVLKQLHPTGTAMFNELTAQTNPENTNVNFGTSVSIETTVAFPTEQDFMLSTTYTFDRSGDLQTGTSTTNVATTTGFTTVTYSSIGAITYNASYDYPGEHVTFALQTQRDTFSGDNVRERTRFDGPSWDKLIRSVNLEEQIIAWPYDTNSGLVVTRFLDVEGTIESNEEVLSMTSGVLTYKIPYASINETSVGSMILLVTYAKNSAGNTNEENNALCIRLSSNATIVPYFDDEVQRNYKNIALNNSLAFSNLLYNNSSNSIQYQIQTPGSVTASSSTGLLVGTGTTFLSTFKEGDRVLIDNFATTYTITNLYSDSSMLVSPVPVSSYASSIVYHTRVSGVPISSAAYVTGSEGIFVFKPYNANRGNSYDRFAMRIEIDQEKQYTTSLTEAFDSVNITSTGLIASWSSTPTSISASSFTSNTSVAYVFDSNAFVLNGGGSILFPFIQTTSFTECGQLDLEIDYLVGDPSNGGSIPENTENLKLQYSTNGGASWFLASDIWLGGSSNIWTYGSTSLTGQIFTSVSSNVVYGIGANFATNLVVGDRLYFLNSHTTTSYTITEIVNNNEIRVTPPTTTALRSSTTIVGRVWGPDNSIPGVSRIYGVGTNFNLLNRDNIISIGSSTTTAYTVVNVVSDSAIDITPALTLNYSTSAALTGTIGFNSSTTSITGTGTAFTTELTTGSIIRFASTSATITSYTVVNINSDTSATVDITLNTTTSGVTGYLISSTGVSVSSYLLNAGVPFFKVLPASAQFQTTSLTVYGPGPETSITVRVIRQTTGPSTDNSYAVGKVKFNAFRYQETTGVVNIHVSVSSNMTFYTADTDYLDITTIGTI